MTLLGAPYGGSPNGGSPHDTRASRSANASAVGVVASEQPTQPPVVTPPRRSGLSRAALNTAMFLATVVFTQSLLSSYFARPLNMSAAGGDPRWIVEVTTPQRFSSTMLLYTREHGLYVFRVPPSGSPRHVGRAVPFGIAHGELRMVSLGLLPLDVKIIDRTKHDATAHASSRAVTAYEPGMTAGVRAGW